jgi:hypothetical protein
MSKIFFIRLSSILPIVTFLVLMIIHLDASSTTLLSILKNIASSQIYTVQVISVGAIRSSGSGLQIVTWEEWKDPDNHNIYLGLAEKSDLNVKMLWFTKRDGPYTPLIQEITQISYNERPVIALTYLYGASTKNLEIFGIEKEKLILLDQKSGSDIGWSLLKDGQFAFIQYDETDKKTLKLSCYVWSKETNKLKSHRCNL